MSSIIVPAPSGEPARRIIVPSPETFARLARLDPRIAERIAVASTGCWEWLGGKGDGYGFVYLDGKQRRAHREVWKQLVEPIPSWVHLDHLCRVRRCVNPHHLEPVTIAVNNRRGMRARLSEEHVRAIRAMKAADVIGRGPDRRTMEQVGDLFGVSGATISRILSGKLWADL